MKNFIYINLSIALIFTSITFAQDSIVVDPWRKTPDIDGVNVIHYGNTRGK